VDDSAYDVVCMGILVADSFVSPLARLPRAGELMIVDDIVRATGGCAANTGVGLAKLGYRVALIGKVGTDSFGDAIVRDMREKGLDPRGVARSPTVPTSKTVILTVTGEDRRFLTAFGTNADLGLDDVDLSLVDQARLLYVGGYLLLPRFSQEDLLVLLKRAKAAGVMTVVDVAVPTAGGSSYALEHTLAEALPYVDAFLPNDDEAAVITGCEDPEEQARILVEAGCHTVVITMGENGALLRNERGTIHAPRYRVDVVDPSGAGDAFDAGYIVGMLSGWDDERTLRFASALGASACMKLGCTPGQFSMAEAGEFLANHHLRIRRGQ